MPRGNTEIVLPRLPRGQSRLQQAIKKRAEEAVRKVCANEEHRAQALVELSRYCRAERAKILGDAAPKLADFRAKERQARKEYGLWSPQQRAARAMEYVQLAKSLGVNVDAMYRLNAYVRKRAALLKDKARKSPAVAMSDDPPGDSFDRNVVTITHPFDGAGHFHTSDDHLAGESELRTSESFLNTRTDVTGGAVRIRNWDADDSDSSWAYQENGFLTCYLTREPASLVKITARFQWVECNIDLDTHNEFGWSDSSISIESSARLAVFLGEAGDLGIETVPMQWWDYWGNGDDPTEPDIHGGGPGYVYINRGARTGSRITVSTIFPEVIPGNTLVGIYVGTRHELSFWVNDVSVDAVAHGKLQLQSIEVGQD